MSFKYVERYLSYVSDLSAPTAVGMELAP